MWKLVIVGTLLVAGIVAPASAQSDNGLMMSASGHPDGYQGAIAAAGGDPFDLKVSSFIIQEDSGSAVPVSLTVAYSTPTARYVGWTTEVSYRRFSTDAWVVLGTVAAGSPLHASVPYQTTYDAFRLRGTVPAGLPRGTFTSNLVFTGTAPDGRSGTHNVAWDHAVAGVEYAPDACFRATTVGRSVAFDGSCSVDRNYPDPITAWAWDFGDGATGAGQKVTHAYATNGSFSVSLTVTSSGGAPKTGDVTNLVSVAGAPAPSQVTGVRATNVTNATASLLWTAATAPAGIQNYQIFRTVDDGTAGEGALVATTVGTSYTDRALSPGVTYQYRVRAVDASPDHVPGPLSAPLGVTTLGGSGAPVAAPPPSQVVGLRAGTITGTSVHLSWSAATGNGTMKRYDIYRSLDQGGVGLGDPIASSTSTSFTDASLLEGKTYYYRVRAVDSDGVAGPLSAILSVTTRSATDVTPPSAVEGLRVGAVTARSIEIQWTAARDDTPGRLHYLVFRANGSATPTTTGAPYADTDATTFVDATVEPGGTYTYAVLAKDSAGNPSSIVPKTTAHAPAEDMPDVEAPAVGGVAFRPFPGRYVVSWSTSEPATCVLTLTGSAGDRVYNPVPGTAFTVDLGAIEPGTYAYAIEASDAAANAMTKTGVFTIDAPPAPANATGNATRDAPVELVVKREAEGTLVSALEQAGGHALANATLFVVQDAETGAFQRIEDATGSITTVHAAVAAERILVQVAATHAFVVVDPVSATAEPAVPQPARVVAKNDTQGARTLTLEVPEKTGWILFNTTDPHPNAALAAVKRGDGTSVPLAYAWREAGILHFMDDPAQTYTVAFQEDAPKTNGTPGKTPAPTPAPTSHDLVVTGLSNGSVVDAARSVEVTGVTTARIARVEFVVDGARVATTTTTPHAVTLDPAKFAAGAHELRADVVFDDGATGSSSVAFSVAKKRTPGFELPLAIVALAALAATHGASARRR